MNLFSEPCSNVGVSLCPSYRLRLWDIHSAKRMILASMDSGTKSEMAPLPVWRQPSKYMGFQTGNMVKAVVPKRKYQGTHIGCLELVLASSGCRSMKKIRPRNGPAFSMTVNGKIGMYYLPHTIIQPNHNYLRFFLSSTQFTVFGDRKLHLTIQKSHKTWIIPPLTKHKYHTMVIYDGNSAGNSMETWREILRKYYG